MSATAKPASALGRARAGVLAAVGGVRSHVFWRVLYRLLSREATVRLVAAVLRVRGGEAALNRFAELLVWSGWPTHPRGWTNLDLSRLEWRVRRRLRGSSSLPARPPRPAAKRLRVGIVGEFSWLINFSAAQLAPLADRVDTTVIDLEYKGRSAGFLADMPLDYVRVSTAGASSLAIAERIAEAANARGLDLLLLLLGHRLAYPTLDLVDAPCVGNLPTGSDLLYHERVGFQVLFQPQADYFLRAGELFCGTSAAPFGIEGVERGFLVNDLRGIEPGPHTPWEEREPLLVAHGSLYKLATPSYLDCVFRLLEDDPALSFVFMGKDDGAALAAVRAAAARRGLGGRVVYDGSFGLFRSEDGGTLEDDGWRRLVDHLRSARLAPDYWPISGGATRFEAYALGVPAPHLGIRYDPAAWGRPQPTVLELSAQTLPLTTVFSFDDYLDLSRRCLYDADFAARAVSAQLEAVGLLADADAYWEQVLACYGRWLARTLAFER